MTKDVEKVMKYVQIVQLYLCPCNIIFLLRLGDRQCTADIKVISKGQLMFESDRVLACSINVKEDICLTGIVGAAMKRKVQQSI